MEFGEVALLGYPVVHLDVNVCVVVAVPWSLVGVSPEPLEVRREASRSGAADQQISTVVVIKGGKGVVLRSFCVFHYTSVGSQHLCAGI